MLCTAAVLQLVMIDTIPTPSSDYSSSSYDDDDDVDFANIDFSGVKFEEETEPGSVIKKISIIDRTLMQLGCTSSSASDLCPDLFEKVGEEAEVYIRFIEDGEYCKVFERASTRLFAKQNMVPPSNDGSIICAHIRGAIISYISNTKTDNEAFMRAAELQALGISAFNLFLQLNYTGPALSSDIENKVDSLVARHGDMFYRLKGIDEEDATKKDFRQEILSELSVDGELCCSIVDKPYFILLARIIFHTLATPQKLNWMTSISSEGVINTNASKSLFREESRTTPEIIGDNLPAKMLYASNLLQSTKLWSGRAVVAHQRLLHVRSYEPSVTLWDEGKPLYGEFIEFFRDSNDLDVDERCFASRIMLEWGLAQHHFDYKDKGKKTFFEAAEISGLNIEVTGATGKRTRFQQDAKAQLIVRATTSLRSNGNNNEGVASSNPLPRYIDHDEENAVLLERVKFEDEADNQFEKLSMLHQAVLLSLCLDVKNESPMDGLTSYIMMAYLERVMLQHDDWMIYSTGLLERAWLECEKSNARERAILQIQALVDQHTQRLTITQSTFKAAVEDSAPAQQRLRNLHIIVYPPRWSVLADLAERYAKMGIVTTAAEMYTDVEMWDQVVECYRRAGKEKLAEEVVRKRLEIAPSPRMWAALGDILNDPSYYEKALELSNYKFSTAYVALGKHYFDKGDLPRAIDLLQKSLVLKPLSVHVWFLLGTICMKLGDWTTALKAFSEVVQQEPEEGDAWGNVAAVHMRNKNPEKAYPALLEVCAKNSPICLLCNVFLIFLRYSVL